MIFTSGLNCLIPVTPKVGEHRGFCHVKPRRFQKLFERAHDLVLCKYNCLRPWLTCPLLDVQGTDLHEDSNLVFGLSNVDCTVTDPQIAG